MSGPISSLSKLSSAPKEFIVLIDPEKETSEATLIKKCRLLNDAALPFIFIGGSKSSAQESSRVTQIIKQHYHGKCVGFPGSADQLNPYWDGILFFSLVGSDNPEYLFKQQLQGTHLLEHQQQQPLIFPSAYILVGNHNSSTAHQTQLQTLDMENTDAIYLHAQTARNLGMSHTYIEAGSGAYTPVPVSLTVLLRSKLDTCLIIGGGIKKPETAMKLWQAGADFVVVGNAIEENPELITAFAAAKEACNFSLTQR